MSNQDPRRVVITGYGALTDLGHSASATWEGMRTGRSGIQMTDHDGFAQYEGWSVLISGQVRDWDPGTILEHREARRLDRCALLGLGAAQEAIDHSGWDPTSGNPTRHGCVIGSGIGGISATEEAVMVMHSKAPSRINPFTVPKLMVNSIAGNICIRFNLQGPATTHATACASSGHAIGDAMNYIRSGKADVMIAGGSEAAVTPLCIGAFMVMKALSTRNDEPTKASRPFDQGRDGFVLAEGAAVFVLESLEHAQARGATIYAELVGAANSCDAGHITAPDPEGRGARHAMQWALDDAGLTPDAIDYINAHGTLTPLGDKAEVAAVKTLFGQRATKGGGLVMSSTKSVHGHCLGGFGRYQELIACIHACRDGIIPPTMNLENPDEGFDIDLAPNKAVEMPVKYAMNNTFGFGGLNVSLICARYEG